MPVLKKYDIEIISEQMGRRKFDPSILLGVASRHADGTPRVLVCASFKKSATSDEVAFIVPFPTNFWLSCPKISKKAGELEAHGGVKVLEEFIRIGYFDEWAEYNKLHAKIRRALAPPDMNIDMNLGVGGTRFDGEVHVKCLHLQVASWLALGFHPGEKWLEEAFYDVV